VLGVTLWMAQPGRSDSPAKPPVPVQKDPAPLPLPKGKELMAAKLKFSQSILEGIALNDFKLIEKNTEELFRVAQVAEFLNYRKGREYELQMLLFKRSIDTITTKSKDKNLDGVMLGYTDMTMTCLKCHQYVRDRADARGPDIQLHKAKAVTAE
jgi:hypothetical protein